MNFFYNSKKKSLFNFDLKLNNIYKVYYYDQFKYIHFFEGRCIRIRKSKNDELILFKFRNEENIISFFKFSPCLISIIKV